MLILANPKGSEIGNLDRIELWFISHYSLPGSAYALGLGICSKCYWWEYFFWLFIALYLCGLTISPIQTFSRHLAFSYPIHPAKLSWNLRKCLPGHTRASTQFCTGLLGLVFAREFVKRGKISRKSREPFRWGRYRRQPTSNSSNPLNASTECTANPYW